MGVWYATRDQVLRALDTTPPLAEAARIDRLIEAASRNIERITHRIFYPLTAAKTLGPFTGGDRLWLNADLQSISSLTEDGTAVSASNYALQPRQYGPPYNRIDLEVAISGDIIVTGVWGFSADEAVAGALAEADDGSETDLNVTDSGKIGIGDLILIGTERMIVTDKALLDTTADLNANLTASDAETTIAFDGAGTPLAGEEITIDSERMFIESVAGTNLIVRRATSGSVLAAHTDGAAIYAPRTLTVARAQAGTSAASHSSADAITKNVPPGLINELCIAEVLAAREQELSGYGRNIGQGEGTMEFSGRALAALRDQVVQQYQRPRYGAV